MRITYLVLIAGLTFACGKIDKQEITSEPIPGSENSAGPILGPALTVADSTKLPICTGTNEGQLVYARAEGVFATCVSGNWTKIDIAGAGATTNAIETARYCTMTISKDDLTATGMDSAPDGGINFFYSVTTFTNKTRYVQARISTGSASYTSGIFWSNKQVGYNTSDSDTIALDIHGLKDRGFFYFTEDATLTGDAANPYAAVYSDPTLTDGKVISFEAKTECTFNVY
jgi:hypothetical protein